MAELSNAVLIVLAINVMLFIGIGVVHSIDPTKTSICSSTNNFDYKNSMLGGVNLGNDDYSNFTLDKKMPYNDTTYPSVTPFQNGLNVMSNGITDMFTGIKNWLTGGLVGQSVNFVFKIFTAPYEILTCIGVPTVISFALGGLWMLFTAFLIINWMKGGFA
jgi:hypothetical protein